MSDHHAVLVLGAGLAGLTAARDLANDGIDVLILEGRDRPGGRVVQVELEDGRLAQLGGEVVGPAHKSYLALVEELGLTLKPAYEGMQGKMTWDLLEGPVDDDEPTWLDQSDRDDLGRVSDLIVELVRQVDPADPWAHPEWERLDSLSVADWLREQEATPGVFRYMELLAAGSGGGSIERGSMLAHLRRLATFAEGEEFTLTVAEGSATVALRMADELGDRVRLNSVVASLEVSPHGAEVTLDDGTIFTGDAVICALPAGPLRSVEIAGISAARLASLRAQRQSCTTKIVIAYTEPFWHERGAAGLTLSEGTFGVAWPQGEGSILSLTVQPEMIGHQLTAPPHRRKAEVLESVARMWGDDALDPVAYLQHDWVTDPFTLGYAARYAPGDLTAIGPLHGTHEHPFYVAGSDHWYAGYMEGAVNTGRSAAAALRARLKSPAMRE